MQLLVI